jgi:hypothetical protein
VHTIKDILPLQCTQRRTSTSVRTIRHTPTTVHTIKTYFYFSGNNKRHSHFSAHKVILLLQCTQKRHTSTSVHTIKDILPFQYTQSKPLVFQHLNNLLLENHHFCRNPGCCIRDLILSVRVTEMPDLNIPPLTCNSFTKFPDFAGIIYRNCCIRKISVSYVGSSP